MPYKYPRINAADIYKQLSEINIAENASNNGKVVYIRNGKLAFDTYENLFTVTPFSEDE